MEWAEDEDASNKTPASAVDGTMNASVPHTQFCETLNSIGSSQYQSEPILGGRVVYRKSKLKGLCGAAT